jgi:amidohydrolase
MPTQLEDTLLERARQLSPKLVGWRRAIHQNPELSFHEQNTAKYIFGQLAEMGLVGKSGVAGTGVTVDIGSRANTNVVGLRADIDALPIAEENRVDYCSKVNGSMHACGHDAHVACLLGAAYLLHEQWRDSTLPGRIKLLFQPGEESVNADKKSGATLMLESGATEGMKALVALHVFPGMPVGKVALRSGPILAACDSFDIVIQGKGCHAAQPDLGVDAVVLASQAVQALQTIVSRRLPAADMGLLTIGGIRSSSYAPNVVAESVELTGTVRYMDPKMGDFFIDEIKRALAVVDALGGSFTLDYHRDTPVLSNDSRVTEVVTKTVQNTLGGEALTPFPDLLGAEDFAYYTQHVPCCFFGLGVGIPNSPRQLHSPTFDINEEALPIGAALLAKSALTLLESL